MAAVIYVEYLKLDNTPGMLAEAVSASASRPLIMIKSINHEKEDDFGWNGGQK